MTDNTHPEALRLADMLTADEWPGHVTLVSYARECVAELRRQHARITEMEAQLEAIGAGGVSGPLMTPLPGAQEAVAWAMFADNGNIRLWSKKPIPHPDAIPLYAAPQPALSAGWVSVDERLPEPNVEVLCAGRGWGNSFVTACYYDDERREWYPINTHWTDATGCAQYPTHWMPLPPSPSMDGESNG